MPFSEQLKIQLNTDQIPFFKAWKARLSQTIADFPGFLSLEMVTLSPNAWRLVQRFKNRAALHAWTHSSAYQELLAEVKGWVEKEAVEGARGVIEVFVTQVAPEQEKAYREWMLCMHEAEAQFPGFRGVYMQAPYEKDAKNWLTLLQFDTMENLDRWLQSSERKKILEEAHALIEGFETHRVIPAFAGWFSACDGTLPPVWKQSFLVLLVLFPVVMLQIRFLYPLLTSLNLSLATFVGNTLSVILIAWPLMPLAIGGLEWWLNPRSWRVTLWGTAFLCFLYFMEILIFWE